MVQGRVTAAAKDNFLLQKKQLHLQSPWPKSLGSSLKEFSSLSHLQPIHQQILITLPSKYILNWTTFATAALGELPLGFCRSLLTGLPASTLDPISLFPT